MATGDETALRIGMLCPGYPTGAPGDYRGIFVRHLVQALKARGHSVCVLTSRIHAEDPPLTRVDDLEEIHRFPFWSEGKLLIEYKRIPVARMMTYMASALLSGRQVFRRFGCDVIHSHFLLPTGLIGAATARLLGRPHVVTAHGSDMRLAVKPYMRPLARWTLRRSRAVTATAFHQMEPLHGLGVDAARLTMMPMGIHEAFLHGGTTGSQPASQEKKIISTRTLREEIYNISQLLRAMRLVADREPEATLTLAGDGPDREQFAEMVRELGLEQHVSFTGWAAPETLARQLGEHRVYVSTSRADGASVSLFEAMACGLFPVVSDIAANREWIRDGANGRLFPLDDPEALAQAIVEALDGTARLQPAIEANRRTARTTFTWDGIALRLEGIYRRVIRDI